MQAGVLAQLAVTHRTSAMPASDLFTANRVILCHFDSYSTALVFARWPDRSLLWPAPLPEGASLMPPPADVATAHDGAVVMAAAIADIGLPGDDLVRVGEFDAWFSSPTGPVRVHLLRFTTFDAPPGVLAAHEGSFKPISELRTAAPVELGMLRQVFDLIMGGGGRA
jgi:hypothetical protein